MKHWESLTVTDQNMGPKDMARQEHFNQRFVRTCPAKSRRWQDLSQKRKAWHGRKAAWCMMLMMKAWIEQTPFMRPPEQKQHAPQWVPLQKSIWLWNLWRTILTRTSLDCKYLCKSSSLAVNYCHCQFESRLAHAMEILFSDANSSWSLISSRLRGSHSSNKSYGLISLIWLSRHVYSYVFNACQCISVPWERPPRHHHAWVLDLEGSCLL